MGLRDVDPQFREHALLSAGERERQRRREALLQFAGPGHRPGRIAAHRPAQHAQRELVREQFLEGEPALGRVHASGQQFELGIGWRTVHVFERRRQRRQVFPGEQGRRQPVVHVAGGDLLERERGQHPQPALLHALGGGVDGRQPVGGRLRVARLGATVFGMDDLEPERAAPHFAEAAQARAAHELFLLGAGEVEEA